MSLMTNLLNPVSRHLNNWNVAPRKGGGGGTSTSKTTSSTTMNKDFQPVVDEGLAELEKLYGEGALGKVAGTSGLQDMVFDRSEGALDKGMEVMGTARETYSDAMEGTGIFSNGDNAAVKQAAIDQAAKEFGIQSDDVAKAGLMGSSRAAIMAGDKEAQLANAMAGLDYEQADKLKERAMWGADSMMQSGQGEAALLDAYMNMGNNQRDIEQEQLDAEAKGLENYLTGIQAFTPLMTNQEQKTVSKSEDKGGK